MIACTVRRRLNLRRHHYSQVSHLRWIYNHVNSITNQLSLYVPLRGGPPQERIDDLQALYVHRIKTKALKVEPHKLAFSLCIILHFPSKIEKKGQSL